MARSFVLPGRRAVEYDAWAPYYDRIRADLGFDWARERASADLLLRLLPPWAPVDPLPSLRRLVDGRDAIVVGLAPRWGAPPVWLLPSGPPPPVILAADGAAGRCLDAGMVPGIVVTDLDGPVPSEILANSRGAFVVVHAHGDNAPALERWVPEFHREIGGSWAGAPEARLLDVGGFTDGDRAAFLASALGARRVLLWGFDPEDVEQEAPDDRPRKRTKLRWAEQLLRTLAGGGGPPLLRWNRDGSLSPYGEPAGGGSGISGASTQ